MKAFGWRFWAVMGACWTQLAAPAFAAGKYTLAFWREAGAWENHGNHSAFVHVWDENGQPLAGKRIYTSWGVLLGATDANGFTEIELRRPNGYDFQIRDGAHRTDTTPVLSVERPPNWGHYSFEIGFLFKSNGDTPGAFDTGYVGTVNSSGGDLCQDLEAPYTRSLAYYSTLATDYCSDEAALGSWTASHGQSFVATGNRVVAVKAMMAAGYNVHYYWTAQVLEGGPGGTPLGPARATRLFVDGEYYPILVKWGLDEVQVVPGRTYYLLITRSEGLNVYRVNRDNYPGGNYFENGVAVPGAEMMGLVVCATYVHSGPLGAVAGSVCDAQNRPLAGVLVRVPDAALYATTGANGEYSIPSVPVATYSVTAAKSGYVLAEKADVAIVADTTTTVNFQLSIAATNTDGLITTPSYCLQPFEAAPAWSSSYDASWGSAATFATVTPGQTGNALQTTRGGPGSSARVLVFPVRTNTVYRASVWARCPRFASAYWAECACKPGAGTAQDFDANPAGWTLLRKFSDTGQNGNNNLWTRYTLDFNSGSSTQASFGFKLGAASSTGPTVQWDQLSLVALSLPAPTVAVAGPDTNVLVRFAEPLSQASATNPANYWLWADEGVVAVSRAALRDPTNVVLETPPLRPRTDYLLTVTNVLLAVQPADLTGLNGVLPVRLARVALALDGSSVWKYDAGGAAPDTAWRLAAGDDSDWSAGPPLLGHALGELPFPIQTPIAPVPNRWTVYFRKDFAVPPACTNAWLRISPIIDDGAVFWLNGAEVLRVGLAKGAVGHGTGAARSVGQPQFEGPFDVPSPGLQAGSNLLAVELHQATANDPDLVFGAQIELLVLPSQTPPDVRLVISRQADGCVLSWSAPATVLERASQVLGPWTPLMEAVSPFTVPWTNGAAFFRLRE